MLPPGGELRCPPKTEMGCVIQVPGLSLKKKIPQITLITCPVKCWMYLEVRWNRDGHQISDLRDLFRSEVEEKGSHPPPCPTSPEAPPKWIPAAIPGPSLEKPKRTSGTQLSVRWTSGMETILYSFA